MTTTTITYKKVMDKDNLVVCFTQSRRDNRLYTTRCVTEEIKECLEALASNKGTLDVTVIFEEVIGE
jgi:hypothetical protein